MSWSEVNCSQFDLQTSTWFGCSVVDSSRTFSHLDVNRHLASVSGARRSPGSSQQLPLVLFDMVELHRPTVYQQCRTPSTNRISTMSNSIDQPYVNNVELHRPTVCQQCRTPSAVVLYVKSSNVELYRPSRITVTMVPPSTMSNSDTAN